MDGIYIYLYIYIWEIFLHDFFIGNATKKQKNNAKPRWPRSLQAHWVETLEAINVTIVQQPTWRRTSWRMGWPRWRVQIGSINAELVGLRVGNKKTIQVKIITPKTKTWEFVPATLTTVRWSNLWVDGFVKLCIYRPALGFAVVMSLLRFCENDPSSDQVKGYQSTHFQQESKEFLSAASFWPNYNISPT